MKFGKSYIGNGEVPIKSNFFVTHVHHDGESHWMTEEQIMQRIQEIRKNKPENEIHPRLSKMKIYAWSSDLAQALKAYTEAMAPVWKAYTEAMAPALKPYEEVTAPVRKTYEEAKAPVRKAYEEATAQASKALLRILETGKSVNALKFEEGVKAGSRAK